jgi:signal transduction histidine kinase
MVQERTQELYEAQEQLLRQEKLAILGQLAGGVAHELRNPLGSIRNAVYFLDMALETPTPEIKNSLQILNRGVDTAERIIHSLLDFARTNVPTRQEIDLNHVIQETLSHVNVPENIQATFQRDEDLPLILADPGQLERVLDNLIRNAIQAMPDGGRLALQTSASPQVLEPGWVSVSCSDTGVGIPPENLEQIFEPLFTTKSKGIGLGLAITRTLVQAHGGSIQVHSQEGQGSTFTMRLPTGEEKNYENQHDAVRLALP